MAQTLETLTISPLFLACMIFAARLQPYEQEGSDGSTYTVTVEVNVKRNRYESRVLGIMEELDGVRIESIE